MTRRRRSKKLTSADIVLFIIVGFIAICIKVYEWLASQPTWLLALGGVSAFIVVGLIIGYKATKAEEKRLAFEKAMNTNEFSDKIDDYWVRQSNFKRQNRVEKRYRKKFLLHLLDLFDNQCANCGDKENGLDLDHFMIPKSRGGNFKLKHNEDGYWVNNAIPLCMTCNRSKSDGDYRLFFKTEKLEEILKKNNLMTRYVNERMEKVPSKKRRAA